jgi:hypothetical protein
MPTSFAYKYRYLTTRKIPKSGGRYRTIVVPRGRLREAQDLALDYLRHCYDGRYGISLLDCHTAFKRGCNAYQNAERHMPYAMSVKFDIKDFFDSVPGFPRKAKKIAAYFENRKQQRRSRIKRASNSKPSRYKTEVMSVYECLVREGIAEDIARWITDIGTINGYLYQGSPLSPLLSSLVTKHCLAKKMLRLATVYDLPVFHMFGDWYMVVDLAGKKVWHYGADEDSVEFKMVQHLVRKKLMVTAHSPVRFKEEPIWERMVLPDGGSVKNMLVGYGQRAWMPRQPGVVARLRRALVRKIYQPGGKGTPKRRIDYRDMQHHPVGKTVFTLYADDGVFSSNNRRLFMVRHVIRRVVEDSGFRVNAKKGIRVMRRCRHITGYQVCPTDDNAKDKGTRVDRATRDREYRCWLDHVRKGKRTLDETSIYHFEGKLAYLKMSNPNWWAIYAAQFRDLLMELPAASPAAPLAALIAERYKNL